MQYTAIDVKEYLEDIAFLSSSIADEREKLQAIFCQATKTTTQLTGMPGGGGSDRDALLSSYVNAKEQLSASVLETNTVIEKTITLIDESSLDIKGKRLLKYRYINSATWKRIAFSLQVSERQIYRIHEKALDDLANYINEKSIKL